jgi:hypothetical protein
MARPSLAVASILATSPLLLTGCGDSIAEKVAESATGQDVDINSKDGSVEVKGKDGTSLKAQTQKKVPDDFPSSVPLPDWDLQGSTTTTVEEMTAFTLTYNAPGDVTSAFEQVKSMYEAAGVKTELSTLTNDESAMFSGTSSTHRVSILVTEDGEKTSATFTVSDVESP